MKAFIQRYKRKIVLALLLTLALAIYGVHYGNKDDLVDQDISKEDTNVVYVETFATDTIQTDDCAQAVDQMNQACEVGGIGRVSSSGGIDIDNMPDFSTYVERILIEGAAASGVKIDSQGEIRSKLLTKAQIRDAALYTEFKAAKETEASNLAQSLIVNNVNVNNYVNIVVYSINKRTLQMRGSAFSSGGGGGGGYEFTRRIHPSGGSLSVSPVPIPPAIWLMGSALVGIFAVARRKS